MKWQPRVFRKKAVDNDAPVKPKNIVVEGNEKHATRNGQKPKRSLPFFPLPTLGTSSVSASSRDASEEKSMPRIGIHLSTGELREEAKARGIDSCYLPNNKVDLLEFLVDGSIHLRETEAWKDIENLRNKMEMDCRRIEQEKEAQCPKETEEIAGKHNDPLRPCGEQGIDWARENSLLEETMQLTLPTRYYGKEASHFTDDTSTCVVTVAEESLVERTMLNLLEGNYNLAHLACGGGSTATPCTAVVPPQALLSKPLWGEGHSLNGSDDDSDSDSDSDSENDSECGSDGDLEDDQGIAPAERAIDMKLQHSVRWQAALQFEQWIIDPPTKNKNTEESSGNGFTVWCSYLSSTMASSKTPKLLTKHFDSSYKNLDDANDRARYLFYWQNPWAHPEDMEDIVNVKSETEDSTSSFYCVHPDGEEWRVSVVPDSVFKYLDHASQERHNLDTKGDF